jgi:hypothetical protein
MRRLILLVAVMLALQEWSALASRRADPRIATAKTAYVVAASDSEDDRQVASCLSDHLSQQTPLEIAPSRDSADLILKVKAHITSGASRILLGSMGGTPSANLEALLPDGTFLWSDGAKYRRGNGAVGVAATDPKCGLADALIRSLREAVHKAAAAKSW